MNAAASPARYLFVCAALVVVVAGMRAASGIVVPFLLAAFLAVILSSTLHFLQNRGLSVWLSLLVVTSAVVFVGLGLVYLFGQSFQDFREQLPVYQERLDRKVSDLEHQLREFSLTISAADADGNQSLPRSDRDPAVDRRMAAVELDGPDSLLLPPAEGTGIDEASPPLVAREGGRTTSDILPPLDARNALPLITRMLGSLGGIFSNAVVILITVIFMLLEASRFPKKLQAIFGDNSASVGHIHVILDNVRRYMAIKTSTSLLTGILVSILLSVLGVSFPMLWGLLAFLFNYIPSIGSILAAIPPVLLALVDSESGLALAAGTAVGFVVINCFISYAIEPRFMGEGLGLSTLIVFMSLVIWGWVLGPIGMLLSAPLTMICKIVLADYEDTRWIAVLMSARAPQEETN